MSILDSVHLAPELGFQGGFVGNFFLRGSLRVKNLSAGFCINSLPRREEIMLMRTTGPADDNVEDHYVGVTATMMIAVVNGENNGWLPMTCKFAFVARGWGAEWVLND